MARRTKYNPERRAWKLRSYRKVRKLIHILRQKSKEKTEDK